jgi:hypothetical protein
MSHSHVSSWYHCVWAHSRHLQPSLRDCGLVVHLKPSNKLLGYYHEVPPGQNLTQFDHDGTAESDGLRRRKLAKQPPFRRLRKH